MLDIGKKIAKEIEEFKKKERKLRAHKCPTERPLMLPGTALLTRNPGGVHIFCCCYHY
jgi:hypothetical protein